MITRIKTSKKLLMLCLLSGYLVSASAQAQTIFQSLNREGLLEITVKTNLTELIENRKRDTYQAAELIYENRNGEEVTRSIKVKPRGKYRRRVCAFPPIKMKFPKKSLQGEGLIEDFNTLKLVTHCLEDKPLGNANVLKEYLTYELFNELTDKSYRSQLVKVTYIDSEKKVRKIKRYGIILENTNEMATRLGGIECEDCMGTPANMIAPNEENLMSVFQYMVGNADWNMAMMRNVKLIQPVSGGKLIPVPYDFDFAGLVNASYAIPNSDYGLLSVLQRAYIGFPGSDATFQRTLTYFISKQKQLLNKVKQLKGLNRDEKNAIDHYLNAFFDQAADLLVEKDGKFYNRLIQLRSTQADNNQKALNKSSAK